MKTKYKTEMLDSMFSYFKNENNDTISQHEQYFLMLDTIFSSMKTAIYVYNRELKLVYANDQTLKLAKMSWAELKEKNYDWLCSHYHCCDMKVRRLRKNLLDKGEPYEAYLRFDTGKGDFRLFKVYNSLLKLENDFAEELFIGEASLHGSSIEADDDTRKISDEISYQKHESFLKNFTPRESEVILHLHKHCINSTELAKLMHLSPFTIRKHLNNIQKKLDLKNILQLVKLCTENLLPATTVNSVL